MNKQQLANLMTILAHVLSLSDGKDSLTDIENNAVFAGIDINDSVIELLLYCDSDSLESAMTGVLLIYLDLNADVSESLMLINSSIAEEYAR